MTKKASSIKKRKKYIFLSWWKTLSFGLHDRKNPNSLNNTSNHVFNQSTKREHSDSTTLFLIFFYNHLIYFFIYLFFFFWRNLFNNFYISLFLTLHNESSVLFEFWSLMSDIILFLFSKSIARNERPWYWMYFHSSTR